MATISPNFTDGFHNRTKYNSSTSKIELAKVPLVKTFPGDSIWSTTGMAWTINGDKATINSNGGNNFLSVIYDVNQNVSLLTFRLKAKGVNIRW